MDPAVIAGLVQLIQFGITTYQQYEKGQLTADQVLAAYSAASDNLNAAIGNFEAAGNQTQPAG